MSAKLDTSKGYGTINGDTNGRRFEQDGKYFDANGVEIGSSAKPSAKTNAEVKPVEVKTNAAPSAVDDQLAKQ